MKRLNYLMLLTTILLLSNCGKSSKELTFDYIPAKENSDDKWGMVDFQGNMLFSDEFENMPTLPFEGVFTVEEEDGYSVYLADKTPKLIDGLDNLHDVGNMSEGLLPIVRKDSRITFVDKSGEEKFIVMPVDGKEIICVDKYSCGRVAFKTEDNKWGFLDKNGKVVIKPVYDEVMSFVDDYCLVIKEETDSAENSKKTYYVIDPDGKEILKIDDKYDQVNELAILTSGFACKKIVARNGERWGFLDFDGKFTKCPKSVENIEAFNEDGYIYSNDYKYGFMSFDNKPIIKAKYEKFSGLADGNFLVKNDDSYLILNKEGEKLLEIEDYDEIIPLNSVLIALSNDEYEFLDMKGQSISANTFEEIRFYGQSMVYSDYFDVNALADKITELYSKDSFCKYVLGEDISSAAEDRDAEDVGSSAISIWNDKLPQGLGYNVTAYVFSGNNAVNMDWDYSNYRWNYTFNHDEKIDLFTTNISTDKDCYDALLKTLVVKFNNKGFKTVENDKAFAKLSHGDNLILITPNTIDGKNCNISFVRKVANGYDDYEGGERLKSQNYLEAKNSSK